MKDPIFFRRTDTLDSGQAIYWKDLFYRVVKIGVEVEVAAPKGTYRAVFEEEIRRSLEPSGCLDQLGTNGVLDVSPEHFGIKIRIIGRQPQFRDLQRQYQAIMKILLSKGARARPTCGLHFHLLVPSLAEPVPEIILANLWNLTRRYAPELKYLTSGGESRDSLCRRRQHNSHVELVRHSSGVTPMSRIQQTLRESWIVPEHQNFLNLGHVGFTESGGGLPFHLEFRFPDMDLAATSIAAKTFLFLVMLLKSVDLSQYGVIHVGRIQAWQRKKILLDMLSNNDGKLAASNTACVTDEVIEELRQGCYELLDLLTPTFEGLDCNQVMDVLLALAERPVSLLRCAGYNWEQIETFLSERAANDTQGMDETDRKLMQRIELGEWAGKSSCESWKWTAAQELFLTPQDLECRIKRLSKIRGMGWSDRQGTMVFTS